MDNFDYITIEPDHEDGGFDVYGHGEYEESSVLAGCPRRCFLDHFDTVEKARVEYPYAEETPHSTRVEGYNAGDLMPVIAPDWFDPLAAGEVWGEDDY